MHRWVKNPLTVVPLCRRRLVITAVLDDLVADQQRLDCISARSALALSRANGNTGSDRVADSLRTNAQVGDPAHCATSAIPSMPSSFLEGVIKTTPARTLYISKLRGAERRPLTSTSLATRRLASTTARKDPLGPCRAGPIS
jgi:hypothetical protein